jgi:hypothetical protein
MNEYKITTSVGDLFVTASSRKHAAIVARQDPRLDGAQIKKISLYKKRRRRMTSFSLRSDRIMCHQVDGKTMQPNGGEVNDGR